MRGLRARESLRDRVGVASVVGTLFFLIVFMLAVGAIAYSSALQGEAGAAAGQADQVAALHAQEQVKFVEAASGLEAVDSGPTTVTVNHVIFEYPNGTVYALAASASVPQGGSVQVASLVPSGTCAPGAETCAERYEQIVAGDPPGSSVGILTSLGNTFWYSASAGSASGSASYYWTTSLQSTSSTTFVPVTGLQFTGTAGSEYMVSVDIGYYQSSETTPGITLALSLPSSSALLSCGGVEVPDVVELCTTSPGTSIGATTFPGDTSFGPNYCSGVSDKCLFVASAMVSFPSSGVFQVEWETTGDTGYIVANSFISVTLVT